jgi:nitrogen fixation protein NifU and related proteins
VNGRTDKPDESTILDHMESPYHRGRAPNASWARTERNAACGDWVRLELVLEADGRVQQAWFDGGGCLISQAAASIVCQAVEGKTIRELRELTAQQMLDLLEIPLTPRRTQCGLLAFKVLKAMVYSLGSATGPERR